jgi:hypothetical protein
MATKEPPAETPVNPVTAGSASAVVSRWVARFKGPIVAIAGTGAVLSGLVGWYTTYSTVKTAALPSGAAATAAGLAAAAAGNDAIYPLSIMVLPFANQTGDAAKAYVADGLTSNITSDLSRILDAMVMAPTQAYASRPIAGIPSISEISCDPAASSRRIESWVRAFCQNESEISSHAATRLPGLCGTWRARTY